MIRILFDKISSTQNIPRIIRRKSNNKEIFIIQSLNQTNGVGRYNRKWYSPNGNIYFSIIFNHKIKFISSINIYICYLLHIFINKKFNLKLSFKWPNDLYFNDKKVIGILTQNEITGSSCTYKIGIGINVNSKINSTSFNSSTLKEILGKNFNLLDLSNSIQKYINNNIFNSINNSVIIKYLNSYLIKTSTTYYNHFNKKQKNAIKIISLNKDFSLKIRQGGLIKNINYGEIV